MVKFIRFPAVKEATGLNRSTIYEMIERGDFPKPVKIGARVIAWPEAEIQEWAEGRIAARENA